MNTIEILLQFVAGEISLKEFEHELYTNKEMEELLCDKSINWSGTYISTNLYDYLIELNYSRIESKVNAIGALELFFQEKGIEYVASKKHSEIYNLFSSTQPKYIDIESVFFEKFILPLDKDLSKSELKQYIRENYEKYFKYQSKPPKWIQNPQWIIKNDKPLFFIGQLELKNEAFHDNGFIYAFLDTETGEVETVKQFY